MIKRTLEISREPAHLAVRYDQLLVKRDGEIVASTPCEDIGVVVVDHPQTTYTHAALSKVLESGAVVVLCGHTHLPQGLLLPLSNHTEVVWRVNEQLAAPVPLKKKLWQQIVRAKILAQAENLSHDSPPYRRLIELARTVRSGDPANHEAHAARFYWSAWLINADAPETLDLKFQRNADEQGLNAVLNYGYAIMRAAVARALVVGGLNPALGVHHSNRGNPFCLADDLMEPLRPLVDQRARELFWAGQTELDQPTKARLLEILAEDVQLGNETGPLQVMLHRYTASLVRCYQKVGKRLEIPVRCKSADTVACGS